MKLISFFFACCIIWTTSQAQTLDYLEKSTSVDIYTSHNFHASTYNNGYFYLVGEFWKDITFGDFSVAFPEGEDDTVWSFILKINEEGEIADLWHFESEDFTRINQIVFTPDGQTFNIVGQYQDNIIYDGNELNSTFSTDGFVMNINEDGSLNWSKKIAAQSEISFASGEALAIDDGGTIYVGFEAGGTIDLDGSLFTYAQETNGALIITLNADGTVLASQQWQMNAFETFIDIVDMEIDANGKLVIGGGLTGETQLGDVLFGADNPNLQSFVIKEDEDLSIVWAKQYIGSNSLVNDLHLFDDKIYVSLQYANFLNVDDTQITGSGSWGDLAIVAVDETESTTVVQNLRLAGNGGTNGVYAFDMVEYLGNLYIGGLYQGVVINDQGFSMGTVGSADFDLSFILSINPAGEIVTSYDFWGSIGPSILRILSASEHRLVFGGEFFQRIVLAGESLQTINSTLFYGSFWDGVVNAVFDPSELLNSCVKSVYPTVAKDVLHLDAINIEEMWIVDAAGKVVSPVTRIAPMNGQVSVAHLSPGLYYLNIVCEEGTTVVKFFKG